MGEDIANDMSNKGLVSKIRKYIKKQTNNKQPGLKMGRTPEQAFFQRRHTDSQQSHESMLNTHC